MKIRQITIVEKMTKSSWGKIGINLSEKNKYINSYQLARMRDCPQNKWVNWSEGFIESTWLEFDLNLKTWIWM